ncbi:Bug family tripartite tricarboxylate transporter substrate binding protein [Nitratireductor sp. CH_MIT9313-5]|jgi:tripartite-type tricarboxylate transporter receptor subunit TctC|uniref:Bug family tripartite tricarboxylate transporter substrate binding protein n=1 Tax=Nitratireductor sp. CH_MIT9313-5 TaxID=3107764 RepID=UPI00300B7703
MKQMFKAAVAVAAVAAAMPAMAQDEYPNKTVEVITHAGAGGGTDVTTRMMMIRGRRLLGQDMVVVNKSGGAGVVAMNYFKDNIDNDHMLMTFTSGHAIQMAAGKTGLTLDDMRPIARGTDDPQIFMTRCDSEFNSPQKLVDAMKDNAIKFGTANLGDIDQISTYVFAKEAGLTQPTIVPFSGGGEVATQLVAGSVDVGVLNLAEAAAQIEAGDICPQIILAEEGMSVIPDAVTSYSLEIPVSFSTIRGFVAPATITDEQAAILEEKLVEAMNHSVYQGYLTSVGLDGKSVVGSEAWGKQMSNMVKAMGPALEELGLK